MPSGLPQSAPPSALGHVHGLVLAAGASSRMGLPKSLLTIDGEPLVCCHVQSLLAFGADVRVVLGGHADVVRNAIHQRWPPDQPDCRVECRMNDRWDRSHMADSVVVGMRGWPDSDLALVLPVDTPPTPVSVLHQLLQAGAPAVPSHDGRTGHPLLADVGSLRRACLAGSLRSLTPAPVAIATAWRDCWRNLNTPAEWADWRRASADRNG